VEDGEDADAGAQVLGIGRDGDHGLGRGLEQNVVRADSPTRSKAGDTLYPALEVKELVPGRTTGVVTLRSTVHNQRTELVLEGTQKFLLRRRPEP
jgi:hypothetical protein